MDTSAHYKICSETSDILLNKNNIILAQRYLLDICWISQAAGVSVIKGVVRRYCLLL